MAVSKRECEHEQRYRDVDRVADVREGSGLDQFVSDRVRATRLQLTPIVRVAHTNRKTAPPISPPIAVAEINRRSARAGVA